MLAPEWSSIRILGLLVLAVVHSGLTQNFYDINRVNKIELFFSEPNWDEILDSLYARGQGERLVGTALINGVRFDSVGVRYKGQSSYHPNRTKNPLNIRLDYIINNQLLDGSFGTLKLSNVYKDPSFVREVLSYEIARKYMAAGGANFTNLYINGQLIGLYTSTQDVDRFFTRTHFYSDEHPRFKGVVDLNIPQPTVWGYFGEDSTHYLDYYELESDSGWHDLINFLNTFNNNNSSVEAVLAVDRLLWMLAFDILMVNLDSPVNTGQNYYLYKSSSGQFNPIIWDLNENFGAYRLIAPGRFLSLIQMQRLDPLLNLSNPYYPIINKILSNPTYQRMYISHMKTIIAENFSNNWYKTRAIEIQQIIDSFVQADPNKFYTYNDFIKNITSTVGTGAQAIVGITELMDARVNFLLNHPALQGIPPFLSSPSWTPTRVYPNTTLWFSVRVDNAELVFLGYRQSKEDAFKKIRMYDDGNHNDGMAGDGIYGTFIKVGSGDIDYYIYAENSIAGRFLPERAEYEFYTIPLSGGKFLALENNIPNPFSHSTRFRYHIPFKSRVLLKIYDSAGREVKTLVDDQKEAGTYTVSLSAHS
ncbi:MAG: CotH kinase family protein, partial [candidate division WOR-3 bacterium]